MNDTSQFGEGQVIASLFAAMPAPAAEHKRMFVDVGAFGRFLSNTRPLLDQGWRGVMIEANPDRAETIVQDVAGLDVQVLMFGAADKSCAMEYHLHSEPTHNSFIAGWYPPTDTGKSIIVPVRPLAVLLEMAQVPLDFELLSVDTEGMDEIIMRCLFETSQYRPHLIITEGQSYKDHAALFSAAGYRFIAKTSAGNEYGNLIYKLETTNEKAAT